MTIQRQDHIAQDQVDGLSSSLESIPTVTVATSAPANPAVGDIWMNSSNGYQMQQWDGAAWNVIQFSTDAIASGSVTTALLAAGAVTAANIQAGTVVAGIVDGTTIEGAQFIAHGASGELLVYDGTPAAGNLILSLSAFAGTDAYGNNYPSGICTTNANGTASNAGYTSRWNPTDPLLGVQPLSLAFLNNVQCGLVSQLELIVQSATSDLVLEAGPASFLRALADNIFIGQAGGQPSKLQFSAGPNGGYYYEEVTLKSPAQTLVSGTVTQIDNLQEGLALYSDYGSAWNLATGVWTCPVTGPYDWNVVMGFVGAMANARCFVRVCKTFNTGPFYCVDDVPISAGNLLSATGTFSANAGDQYHVEVYQSTGASHTLDNTVSYVHIGRRL